MGIDTRLIGGNTIETTPRSWPKCARCSERLGYEYPVEVFAIESRTKPTLLNGAYQITIRAQCHDATQFADVEIPAWAAKTDKDGNPIPSAIEVEAIGRLRFFQRSGTGLHAKVATDLPRKV